MVFSSSACADDDEYNVCLLQYQKGAKTNLSAYLIEYACRKLYQEGAFLLGKEKAYNECLLKNIPGVENSMAVNQIQNACRRQYLE
ncbi:MULTISPECIES: VF_A0006 family four-cysteine protein [unclassified Pseudomonas]|uniref:VF_A0006 family four-cysteine protein n=1 Tax=unclassified Pseudomonas TaxID=196821 RepID=UPI00273DA325|nr:MULTISPECIES: VF_A0006 family four-cysteine protein [unclassified Pseudomonas]